MISLSLYVSLVATGVALAGASNINALHKRETGDLGCYDLNNISAPNLQFSALCPPSEWPITNDRGLNVMGVFYFALASSTVPDDTTYNAGENIICTVTAATGNITVTAGVQAHVGGVGPGASVSFSLSLPSKGSSICMFPESIKKGNTTDPITLAQARELLLTMLTSRLACKTCGRIPINYPDVMDGVNGGILKLDVTTHNNCIEKCVGPNSFSKTVAPNSTANSTTNSTTNSTSASRQLEPLDGLYGLGFMTALTTAWALGFVGLGLNLPLL